MGFELLREIDYGNQSPYIRHRHDVNVFGSCNWKSIELSGSAVFKHFKTFLQSLTHETRTRLFVCVIREVSLHLVIKE